MRSACVFGFLFVLMAIWGVGCRGILDIETDRKVVNLDSAGGSGGEGGDPGEPPCQAPDCANCPDERARCLCEEDGDEQACDMMPQPKFCDRVVLDSCTNCMCDSCEAPLDFCESDDGCRAVMNCALTSQCDPGLSPGPDSCYQPQFCRDVIDDNGGPTGPSVGRLAGILQCVLNSGCECGDQQDCRPENGCMNCFDCYANCTCNGNSDAFCQNQCFGDCRPENGCINCVDCRAACSCNGKSQSECDQECSNDNCQPDTGCQNCFDCYSACICDGKSQSECDSQCGFSSCTSADGCENCQSCRDECYCQGGDTATCDDQCGAPSCSFDTGCNDCADCYAECYCNGGDDAVCENECGVVGPRCTPDSCSTCSSCLTECSCEGQAFLTCENQCGWEPNCSAGDCGCETCMASCECQGSDPQVCIEECLQQTCDEYAFDDCEKCLCESCSAEHGRCLEDQGCLEIVDCVRQSPCVGPDCIYDDSCTDLVNYWGGPSSRSAAYAQAELQCSVNERCPCDAPNGEIQCGVASCYNIYPPPPEPIINACCPADEEDWCGVDFDPFRSGTGCVPLYEDGFFDAACPDLFNPGPPYGPDETLYGCCRSDNTCGYMDDFFLDTGCMKADLFGNTADASVGCSSDASSGAP